MPSALQNPELLPTAPGGVMPGSPRPWVPSQEGPPGRGPVLPRGPQPLREARGGTEGCAPHVLQARALLTCCICNLLALEKC